MVRLSWYTLAFAYVCGPGFRPVARVPSPKFQSHDVIATSPGREVSWTVVVLEPFVSHVNDALGPWGVCCGNCPRKKSPGAVAMARAWEKVNTRRPKPRARTPIPMSSSACSRLRKAIAALDGGEVHKTGSFGSQVRERRILVTLERSDGRSAVPVPPEAGMGVLLSRRGSVFGGRRPTSPPALSSPAPGR